MLGTLQFLQPSIHKCVQEGGQGEITVSLFQVILLPTHPMPIGWLEGVRLSDGEQGWFPLQQVEFISNPEVRARNLKEAHRVKTAKLQLVEQHTQLFSGRKPPSLRTRCSWTGLAQDTVVEAFCALGTRPSEAQGQHPAARSQSQASSFFMLCTWCGDFEGLCTGLREPFLIEKGIHGA